MQDYKSFLYLALDQVQRQKWKALIVTWLVCLIGWAVVAGLPDRYVSEARFHIDTTSMLTPLLKGISVSADDQSRDRQIMLMQRTLTSRPNLLKVAQMTDLDKTARSDEAIQDLLAGMERRISIKAQGTNLFLVEYTDTLPRRARDVVQSLLTIFVESSLGNKRADITSARTFIDKEIEDYERKLKDSENRLADFKIRNVQFFSSTSQTFAGRMEAAQDAVKTALFEYEDSSARRDRLAQQISSTPRYLSVDTAPMVVIGDAPRGGSFQQRANALQARLDDLKMQYTDMHPEVVSIRRAMADLRKEKEAARNSPNDDPGANRSQVPNEFYSQLSLRLEEAQGQMATAKRKLAESQANLLKIQAQANEAPTVEAELSNLNRDYQVLRTSYDTLLQRRESARIADAADATTEQIQFQLIAAPEIPARPAGPPRELFNCLVLLIGLLAGPAFVVLLSHLNDCVVTTADLTAFTECRVLGSVSLLIAPKAVVTSLRSRLTSFTYATAGLAAAFVLVLFGHPTLAAITERLM